MAGDMGIEVGPGGRARCWWCLGAPEYVEYHDRVWGRSIEKIATYGEGEIERLLADSEIVRHRGKIEATIANAAATHSLHEEGETLDALLWSFAPARDGANPPKSGHDLALTTRESKAMAKELKRRGFRFVGPTTAYSLMQAAGLVNDHLDGCAFR